MLSGSLMGRVIIKAYLKTCTDQLLDSRVHFIRYFVGKHELFKFNLDMVYKNITIKYNDWQIFVDISVTQKRAMAPNVSFLFTCG